MKGVRATLALAVCLCLALTNVATAGATISFYSHGWGVGENLFLYFPHAFVVIQRSGAADDPPKTESWGYTAASTSDITVLMRPSRGAVQAPNETYRQHATQHFTVALSNEQYQVLEARIAYWGAPTSPLYNLSGHNCISFVADLATSIGLKIPDASGRDPAKFLEGVKRLNPDRIETAVPQPSLTSVSGDAQRMDR